MSLWTMTDEAAGKPKYLSDELRNEQTVSDKDATIGINVAEALDADSTAKGLGTPGWVTYTTYTDSNGNVRHKSEVLVAASSIASDGTETLVDDLGGAPAPTGTTYTGWPTVANQGVTLGGTTISLYRYPQDNLGALWTAIQAATAGDAISFVIGGVTFNGVLANPAYGGGGPSLPYINIQPGAGTVTGEISSITFG